MKNLKKLFLFLIIAFGVLIGYNMFKIKAGQLQTSSELSVLGAQIRTEGNAGIKFVGHISDEYDRANISAYGIICAYGETEASDDFKIGGTVNEKSVLDIRVTETDENGNFNVVIYDIPENQYGTDISARAYVIDNDKEVYADTVTIRSIATVARGLANNGEELVGLAETVANKCRIKVTNGNNVNYYSDFTEFEYSNNDVVEIIPGTYTKTYINNVNVKLIGPNHDKKVGEERNPAAVFTGILRCTGDYCEINGIDFTGNGQLILTGPTGYTGRYAIGCTLKSAYGSNCTLNDGGADGFVYSNSTQVQDFRVIDCTFINKLARALYLPNINGLIIKNSYFEQRDSVTNSSDFLRATHVYGDIIIDGNQFNSNYANALLIGTTDEGCEVGNSSKKAKLYVVNNNFNGCGCDGFQALTVRTINNLDMLVEHNVFNNNPADGGISIDMRGFGSVTSFDCSINFNKFISNVTYIIEKDVVTYKDIINIDNNYYANALTSSNIINITIPSRVLSSDDIDVVYGQNYNKEEIVFENENNVINVGETLDILTSSDIETWNVISGEDVISVNSSGKVTGLKLGSAVVEARTHEGDTGYFGVTVLDNTVSPLIKLLAKANNAITWNENIDYYDYKPATYTNNVSGSVNQYWAGTNPAIIDKFFPEDHPHGGTMTPEFITVHDTGAATAGSNAAVEANWAVSSSNSASWHYTIGNDGIYKHCEDNVVTYHAGDGSMATTLRDTGIAVSEDERYRPTCTLGSDGYIYVDGVKTNLTYATKTGVTPRTNELGLATVRKNGRYYIPYTWVSGDYGNRVCIKGGGSAIGIETCANDGSDIYLTWQMTAKFVAQKLIELNLTPDRVLLHNNFSNKSCPNTMMMCNKVEMFLDMVYTEYDVLKDYSDFNIAFETVNNGIIDSQGRVVHKPATDTLVKYVVHISNGVVSEDVTLYSIVKAKK